MKNNDVETIEQIKTTNLANLFNVHEDPELGNFVLTYGINRTFNIVGLSNINRKYYTNYVVKSRDTWLSIAYDLYDDTRLWWLVCKMNEILDPTISPITGGELKILKKSFIYDILGALELG